MKHVGSFCSHLPRGLRNFVVHQSPTGGALVTRNGSEENSRPSGCLSGLRRSLSWRGNSRSCSDRFGGGPPSEGLRGAGRLLQAGEDAFWHRLREATPRALRLRRRPPKRGGERLGWAAGRLRRNWGCSLEQPCGRACRSLTCSAFWPQALCLAPPARLAGVLLQNRAVGTLRAGLEGFPAFFLGWEGFPASTSGLGMAGLASRAAFARLARCPAADQGCWDSACRSRRLPRFLPGVGRLFYLRLGNGRKARPNNVKTTLIQR